MEYLNEQPSTSTGKYASDLSVYNHQYLNTKKNGTVKKKWRKISFKVKHFINRKFTKSFKRNTRKTKFEGICLENRSNNKNLTIRNRFYCFNVLPYNIQSDIDQIKQIYNRILKRIENLKKFLHNPKYVKNSNINRLNGLVKQFEKQEERNNEVLKSFINGIYLLWKEYKQKPKGQHGNVGKINTKKYPLTSTNNQRELKIAHTTVETLPLENRKFPNSLNIDELTERCTTNEAKETGKSQPSFGTCETSSSINKSQYKNNDRKEIRNKSELCQSNEPGEAATAILDVSTNQESIEEELYLAKIKGKLDKTNVLLGTVKSGSYEPQKSVLEISASSSQKEIMSKNFGRLSHKQINVNRTENLMEQNNSHIQIKAPVKSPNTNSTYQCNNIRTDNKLTRFENTDFFANKDCYSLAMIKLKKEEDPITAHLVKQVDENVDFYSYNSLLDITYKSFRIFVNENSMMFSEYEENIESGNCYYYKNYERKFPNTTEGHLLVFNEIFSQEDWIYADLKDPSDLTDNPESERTYSKGMSTLPLSNVGSLFADLEYSSHLKDTIKHSRDMSRKSAYPLQLKKVSSEVSNNGVQIKETFNADIPLPPEPSSSDSNIDLRDKSYQDLKRNQYLGKRTHLLPATKTLGNRNYNIPSIYTILAKNEVLNPRYKKWIENNMDDTFKQQTLCTRAQYITEHASTNRKLSSEQEEKISGFSKVTVLPSSKNSELDLLNDLSPIEINSTCGTTAKLMESLPPKGLPAETNKEIFLPKNENSSENEDKNDSNDEKVQIINISSTPQTFSFKNLQELNNCDPAFTPLLENSENCQNDECRDTTSNSIGDGPKVEIILENDRCDLICNIQNQATKVNKEIGLTNQENLVKLNDRKKPMRIVNTIKPDESNENDLEVQNVQLNENNNSETRWSDDDDVVIILEEHNVLKKGHSQVNYPTTEMTEYKTQVQDENWLKMLNSREPQTLKSDDETESSKALIDVMPKTSNSTSKQENNSKCDQIVQTDQVNATSKYTETKFNTYTSKLQFVTLVHVNIIGTNAQIQQKTRGIGNKKFKQFKKLAVNLKRKTHVADKSYTHKHMRCDDTKPEIVCAEVPNTSEYCTSNFQSQTLSPEPCTKLEKVVQTEEKVMFVTEQIIQTDVIDANVTDQSTQSDKVYTETSEKGIQMDEAAMLTEQISQTEELAVFTFEQSAQTDEKNESTMEEAVQTHELSKNKILQTENVAQAVSVECTQTDNNNTNGKDENIQTETAIIGREEQMVQTEKDAINVCDQSFQTEETCTNLCNESVQTLPRIVTPIEQITQTESGDISVGVQTQEVVKCVSEQFTLTEEACVSDCDRAVHSLEKKVNSEELVHATTTIEEEIVQTEPEERTDPLNNGDIDFDREDEEFGLDKLFLPNNAETCNFVNKDKRMKHTRPCSLILSLKFRPLLPNAFRNRRKKPPRTTSIIDRPQAYYNMTERVNITKNVDMENNDYEFSPRGTLPRCDEERLQDEIVEPQQLQTFTDNKLHLENSDGNVGNHIVETRKKPKTMKLYSRPCSIVFRLKSQSVPLNIFAHNRKMGRLKSKSAMDCAKDIKNQFFPSRNVETIKEKQPRRIFSYLPTENPTTSSINVWDYFTRSPFKRTYDGDYTDIVNSGFRPNGSTDSEWVRKLPKSEEYKCLEDTGDLDFQEADNNKYSAEESPTFNIPLLKSASDVSASETSDDETWRNVKFKEPTLSPANQGEMRVIQAWPENGTYIKLKTRQKKKIAEHLAPVNLLMDEDYILRKKESKKFDRVIIEDLSTQEFETVTHLKPCHIEIANDEQKTECQQEIKTFNTNTENLKKRVKFFSLQNEPQRFDDLIIEDLATETFNITTEGLKPSCFEMHMRTQDSDYRKHDVSVHAQESDHPLKSENGYSSSVLEDDGVVRVKPLRSPNADNRIDNRIEKTAFLPMQRSKKYKSTLLTKELRQCEDVSLGKITTAEKDNAIIHAYGSVMDLCHDNLKSSITEHLELNFPFTSPQKINLNNEINLSSRVSKQSPSSKKRTNASSLRNITYSTHRVSSKGIYSSYSPIKLILRKNLNMCKCKSCPDIYRRFKSDLGKHKVKSIANKKSLAKIYPESNSKYNEYQHEIKKCNHVKYSVDSESSDEEDLITTMEYAGDKKPKNDHARETEDDEIIKTVVACVDWMHDVIADADNFSASDGLNNDEITSLEQHSMTETLPLRSAEERDSAPESGENGNDRERRTEVTSLKATSKMTPALKNF